MDFDIYIPLIKQKRELSGIDDSIILDILKEINSRGHIPSNPSDKEIRLIVKQVRAELRKYVGRFSVSQKEKLSLLKKGEIKKLLETHSSTKERLPYYPEVLDIIKKVNPHSILDLGCGLNPLAIANNNILYYASDINKDDLEIVRLFFDMQNIKGKVFVYDARKSGEALPEADLVILFKLFDVIEKRGHKLAEKIISELKCKSILVSFSTKTISGRAMNHPQRGWIERLLSRLNYKFEIFKIKNEIFYLVHKF